MKDKIIKHDRWVSRLDFQDILEASKDLKYFLEDYGSQFIYDHETELIKAQAQFIELGKHMLEFIDWVSDFLRENYYKILILVLQRSEFDLA